MRVQGALLVAAVGVSLLLRDAWRALERDAVPPAISGLALRAPSGARRSDVVPMQRLVALAPFSVARREGVPSGVQPPITAMADAPGVLRLIGTVADGDGSFAVCQLGAARPKMLHPGDTLGGWQLQHVAPGRATFVDAARTRHELRLTPTGN
jgi:hypothetical protein